MTNVERYELYAFVSINHEGKAFLQEELIKKSGDDLYLLGMMVKHHCNGYIFDTEKLVPIYFVYDGFVYTKFDCEYEKISIL